MSYWLLKSEPDVFSIDDLRRQGKTYWDAVRNYQARNYLKQFSVGDECLYYHSNATPSGIVGIAKCSKVARPDKLQFDPESEYYDAKATKENPRWFSPQILYRESFPQMVTLEAIKAIPALKHMALLKASRLSVQPVSAKEFETIVTLSNTK